jgi:hypothetical protein
LRSRVASATRAGAPGPPGLRDVTRGFAERQFASERASFDL